MVQGIPYDSPEGRAQCGAVTALMHAASYATSAEIAAASRAVPALPGQSRADAARHPQPPPGRLQRAGRGLRGADHPAGRHRSSATARTTCSKRPAVNAIACWSLGEKHGYRNAQVTCIAPTGTIALVMDCDTTGVEPDFALVKFKKLAGGGYFKIINASIPPALARLGYTPRADRRDRPLLPRPRHAARLPAHQPRPASRPRASPTRCSQRIETQLPARLRAVLCLQSLDRRRRRSCRQLGLTEEQIDAPGFDLLAALGFTRDQIAEANAVRLRHHDHRGRAAPASRSTTPSSTAPTSAARSASVSCRPSRTSA